MAVYDIAANQVLAKPVSSFMQGRAMQIALQSEKLKNTAMEQEIGAFDAREARAERGLRVEEGRARTAASQEERLQKQQQSEEDKARAEAAKSVVGDPITRDIIIKGLDDYEAAATEEEKLKIQNDLESRVKRYYPDAPGFDDNGDGILSPEEVQARRSELQSMAQKDAKVKAVRSGINPATNKEEDYIIREDGSIKWTGVQTPESASSLTERESLQAKLQEFSAEYEAGRLQNENLTEYKLTWLRAIATGMDPERAGLKNPGVSPEEPKFTAAQKQDLKSSVSKMDLSADLIDTALRNVGPWTVGAPGMAKQIQETVSGFLNNKTSQPAKDFERALTKLKSMNWKEMVGSGQISTSDYMFLDKIFAGDDFGSDPVSTARSLIELRDFFYMKRDESAASLGWAPQAALRYLEANPETKDQFKEMFPNDPHAQ